MEAVLLPSKKSWMPTSILEPQKHWNRRGLSPEMGLWKESISDTDLVYSFQYLRKTETKVNREHWKNKTKIREAR